MKKAAVPILVAVILLTVAVVTEAQQTTKVPRIGYLSNADAATDSARAEGIRLALRELGYIDGQNIAIEYRFAEGKLERTPELAAELVRLKVDIIVVASGDPTIQAAKNATKTIPIVMMGLGSDPVRAGHVESLDRKSTRLNSSHVRISHLPRLNSQPQRTRRDWENLFHLEQIVPNGWIVENCDTGKFGNRFFQ